MAKSYSDRDLDIIPNLTFSFVEDYIQLNKTSSGQKSINKGFKYFSEGYITDLRVQQLEDCCEVAGRCFRSQKKTEVPHQISIYFKKESQQPEINKANCSCPIGLCGSCGHITGVLYQIAKYKLLGLRALPEDVAKTSQPQTWHVPRGEHIRGKSVQDFEVSGYHRTGTDKESTPKTIKSTLYNPIRGEPVDWKSKHQHFSDVFPDILVLPALKNYETPLVNTKFGMYRKGSVISYQQPLESGCVINLYDGIGFPDFPVENVMQNNYSTALPYSQLVAFEGLSLSISEINKFEKQTRLQSQSPLWFKIRKHRITASKTGDIYRRRKDFESLATRLKSSKHVTTAAMRRGLACEPVAANSYAEQHQNKVNLYPCGVIVSFYSPWLAASPDRKVYNPERNPPFGLLEIKCPNVVSVLEVKYLKKDATGTLNIKRNHSYYYQILTQLAVSGLKWCDLYVWCENDEHLETIYLNEELWEQIKNKVDEFYFTYFI